MAVITLNKGYRAIVDAADLPKLGNRVWRVVDRKNLYAISRGMMMHRLLLDAPAGSIIDHRDGDGLNNRRSNIRLCTHAQNMRNSRRKGGSGSGFKGVYWHKGGRRWAAYITVDGRAKHLGYFDTPEEAARAHDAAAVAYHGEFARPNLN